MAAVSSPAILRISAAAPMPYATVERLTRPLIPLDRWVSRSRRELLASDLASLLNAIMGWPSTDAAETDTLLRSLEYQGTSPQTLEQKPTLGETNWGTLLEKIIQNPPVSNYEYWRHIESGGPEVPQLPHFFETSLNPISVLAVWLDNNGVPAKIDHYGPASLDVFKRSRPYGRANFLRQKSFLDSGMIALAGEILRDSSQRSSSKRNPKAKDAALAGAALRDQDRHSTAPEGDTSELKAGRDDAQAESSGGSDSFSSQGMEQDRCPLLT